MGYAPTPNDWALSTIFAPSSLPPLPQVPGNIDLSKRRPWLMPDGSGQVGTVDSFSFQGPDGREVLAPLITGDGGLMNWRTPPGQPGSPYDQFANTGQHLGIFDTPQHANAYAEWLHQKEAARIAGQRPAGVLHYAGHAPGTLTHPRGPI